MPRKAWGCIVEFVRGFALLAPRSHLLRGTRRPPPPPLTASNGPLAAASASDTEVTVPVSVTTSVNASVTAWQPKAATVRAVREGVSLTEVAEDKDVLELLDRLLDVHLLVDVDVLRQRRGEVGKTLARGGDLIHLVGRQGQWFGLGGADSHRRAQGQTGQRKLTMLPLLSSAVCPLG